MNLIIAVKGANGQATKYQFLPFETSAEIAPVLPNPQNKSGAEIIPVSNKSGAEIIPVSNKSGAEIVPLSPDSQNQTGAEMDTNQCKNCTASGAEIVPILPTDELPPPLTPPGGQVRGEFLNNKNNEKEEKNAGGNFGDRKMITTTLDVVLKNIGDAYREAWAGAELPKSWEERISAEYEKDNSLLLKITPEILTGAEQFRQKSKWDVYAMGTVLKYLEHLERNARRLKTPTAVDIEKQKKAQAETAHQEEIQQRTKRELDYFHTLASEIRSKYVTLVMAEKFAPTRSDLIERKAAAMAFLENSSQDSAVSCQ